MQLVFEFCAAEARPLVEAVQSLIGESEYQLRGTASGTRVEIDGQLELTAPKLESGDLDSFVAYPQPVKSIRYAMVTRPVSGAEPRSTFMGTLEYTARDYQWIWDLLLRQPKLTVVCLGLEEGVDLRDGHLTADTFPWDQWPLIIGAVRVSDVSRDGGWFIKNGPEMRWFQEGPAVI